jgi:hypothetical protein
MKYLGGCHCGAIKFEVDAPEHIIAEECNCSICTKSGYLHLIVPQASFKLLRGQESIHSYSFNTGVARHMFCKTCGVKSFYIPRSNPNGVDVNVHCLDTQPRELTIRAFDGVNWEENAHRLAHLSDPKG